ncbi:hypothetical protein LEP1GSC058_2945 [Leptospira fainei serovar Hurstbridge str. BUT 6]|uniref:Uncharacterized protein n=1 Tax=Leptospira fainei serovar Hurstbridge str. BUT 6 TaxID=1193011 RepID=S3UYS7_9LEPT|nr:hypothetical protein LEP1GSC058_2945 [Leptospira fainei serovar Hurstbridge str. BUT 6]
MPGQGRSSPRNREIPWFKLPSDRSGRNIKSYARLFPDKNNLRIFIRGNVCYI